MLTIVCCGTFLFFVLFLSFLLNSSGNFPYWWSRAVGAFIFLGWAMAPIVFWTGTLALFASKAVVLTQRKHVLLVLVGSVVSVVVMMVIFNIFNVLPQDPMFHILFYVPSILMSAICLILIPIFHRLRRSLHIENLFQ